MDEIQKKQLEFNQGVINRLNELTDILVNLTKCCKILKERIELKERIATLENAAKHSDKA